MTATRLNPTITPEEWSATNSTNGTYVKAVKYGSVVTLEVYLNYQSAPAKGTWYGVATLPSGWWPRHSKSSATYTTDGSAYIGILEVSSDTGRVQIHSSGAASKSWRASLAYVV